MDTLVDYWLQSQGLVMMRYLSVCSNIGSPIEGLFVWLASYAFSTHVNVIHGDRVWTTRQLAMLDFREPAIVFVLGYYMAAPACTQTDAPPKKKVLKTRA